MLKPAADYSWTRPDPQGLVSAGYGGVIRYAPHGSEAVQLTKAEVDALRAAGLQIAVVIQVGVKFVTEGYARGALEARRSVEITRACGLPDGDVYVAVDFDATLGGTPVSTTALDQMRRIAETFKGVASVVGQDHVRPYGGYHVLTWLYKELPWLKPGWQPQAWSQVGGQITYHPNIALKQHWPSIPMAGGTIDHNTVLMADWGQRVEEATVDVAASLAAMGWRTNSTARLRQAIWDFQRGWNLGPALQIDGIAGPKTRAAIEVSMSRRAEGKPDFSPNFYAREFICKCSPTADDCKRIFVRRALVQAAEKLRTLVGSYTPVRASRCATYNKQVGGVSDSQHRDGDAMDLPVFDVTIAKIMSLGVFSGIGYYETTKGRRMRHGDVRHMDAGETATPSNPDMWKYGTFTGTLVPPKPPTTTPTPTPPAPTPAPPTLEVENMTPEQLAPLIEEAVRKVVREEGTARAIWTGHEIVKDVRSSNPNPDDPTTRVTPSTLLEAAVVNTEGAQ